VNYQHKLRNYQPWRIKQQWCEGQSCTGYRTKFQVWQIQEEMWEQQYTQ